MPPAEKTKELTEAILERWDDRETRRLARMREDALDFAANDGEEC
jgi:hypothetical protein